MKKQTIFFIAFAISFIANLNAQQQEFIKVEKDTICVKTEVVKTFLETTKLIQIAEKFGSDSVFRLINNQFPIHKIDTITSLKLLQYIKKYEKEDPNWTNSKNKFFVEMAHYWKNEYVGKKVYDFTMIELAKIQTDSINESGKVFAINDNLLKGVMSQRPDFIAEELIKCYEYCKKLAEAYQEKYPSEFDISIDSIKNKRSQIINAFETCHQNCYKIMTTLGKIESPYYDSSMLAYHNSKVRESKQKKNKEFILFFKPLERFSDVIKPKEITLSKNYDSLAEINFQDEPEFIKNTDRCFKGSYFLIFNNDNNRGIMRSHCAVFEIELKDKNKLIMKTIQTWAFL